MVYVVGVLISFLLYLVIGAVLSKSIKGVEDYYVAGRNAPTLLIVGSLVATFMSTVAFMGEISISYDGYPLPMIIQVACVSSGFVFGVMIFGKYLRRSEVLTLPEYFGERFNSLKVRRLASTTLIIGLIPYLVAVTQGAAIVLSELVGISYGASVIIVTFIFTAVTFLSGAKGVLVTDTVMFLLFTVASFACIPFILNASGGWPKAFINTENLQTKPDLLAWHGITGENAYLGSSIEVMLFAIIIGLILGVVLAVSPWQTSRYLMAKNEHVAIRSGIISGIILLLFIVLLHPVIATINVINPSIEPSEQVFIWAAMNLTPTWLGVLTICGILAAALSSSSTFLQLIGNSITKDLFISTSIPNKRLLFISRLAILGVGIIIVFITIWEPPAIYWIGVFAATLFAASWGPTAIASIYSKTVTKEAAFWSILTGFVVVFVIQFFEYINVITLPIYLHSVIFGTIASLITLIVVSKFTKPTIEEVEYRQKLFIRSEEEFNAKDIKRTKRYPKIMIVGGLFLTVFMFFFYYFPVHLLP